MKIGMIMPNQNDAAGAFPAGPFDPRRSRGRIPLDGEFREGLECAFRCRIRAPNCGRSPGRQPAQSRYRPNNAAQKQFATRKMLAFGAICEFAALGVAHPLQTTIHRWDDFYHGTNDSISRFLNW